MDTDIDGEKRPDIWMYLCESFPNQNNLLSLKNLLTFYYTCMNFPGLYFFSTIFHTFVSFNCIGLGLKKKDFFGNIIMQ